MTTIFLVRHGESQGNANRTLAGRSIPYRLTEKGVDQTRRLTQDFANIMVDAIYTSPMLRTVETANILADFLRLKPVVDERFTEVEIGSLVGKNVDQLNSEDPDWTRELYDESYFKYGIEKYPHIARRMFGGLNDITKRHRGSNVIVVSHLDPIKSVIASILALTNENIRRITIANASITVVENAEGSWRILVFNLLPLRDYLDNGLSKIQ